MKIGIIGAGNIGGNLGKAWAAQGHDIVFGVRDPKSAKINALLASITGSARAASIEEAAAFGDVVVIAVHWDAIRQVVPAISGALQGKIVIDPTNRFAPPQPGDRPSAAEDIARMAPGARVIKAFNTVPAEKLLDPVVAGMATTAFIVGDDVDAKRTVMALASAIGFDAVDGGALANADAVEKMLKLFMAFAQTYGRSIGFRLLHP